MKIKAMETNIEQVYGLLRGEIVKFEMEGQLRKIRFLNPELDPVNTRDPVPLHVSAFGPRTRELTARLGAGWLDFVGNVEVGIREVDAMRQECRTAGRSLSDLSATAFALGCVLQDGEPAELRAGHGSGRPAGCGDAASCGGRGAVRFGARNQNAGES